jgi:hypothetical protein
VYEHSSKHHHHRQNVIAHATMPIYTTHAGIPELSPQLTSLTSLHLTVLVQQLDRIQS